MSLADEFWQRVHKSTKKKCGEREFKAAFNWAYSRGFSDGLERAATKCDAEAQFAQENGYTASWREASEACAARIRALKEQP